MRTTDSSAEDAFSAEKMTTLRGSLSAADRYTIGVSAVKPSVSVAEWRAVGSATFAAVFGMRVFIVGLERREVILPRSARRVKIEVLKG
jgi:hypothetical protein